MESFAVIGLGRFGMRLARLLAEAGADVLAIDRERDLYCERVADLNTGEVLMECVEPLSRHQGHGSAKRRTGTKNASR